MSEKSVFVVTFPLITEPWQEDVLNKRINMCHRIYNQCVKKTRNKYKEMAKTRKFRAIRQELKEIREAKAEGEKKKTPREKELYTQLNQMYKDNGFTEFSMMSLAREQARDAGYKKNIDSTAASKVGKRLWTAWDKFLFGDGTEVHFSRYYDYNSVEGSYNTCGIRLLYTDKGNWKGNRWAVVWNKVYIPIRVSEDNMYEQEALRNEIAYNRIIRKVSNGKQRFYVQTIFRGTPPRKRDKKTGDFIHTLGHGRVGLYITLTKLTAVTDEGVKVYPLADGVEPIEDKIAEVQRKMDSSRRATNPDNYNEDGTIKKQGNKKVIWIRSNHYERLRTELKSLQTKQADVRKYEHECLANKILSLGDDFVINKQDFKSLQQRKEKTEYKEDGTQKSKKQFGTVIKNHAPSEFVQILNRKLESNGNVLHVVDVNELGINKFNHSTGDYDDRDSKAKTVKIEGQEIDKYTYMAFLLQNLTPDYSSIDRGQCSEKFMSIVS